jgi:hypothetical protein
VAAKIENIYQDFIDESFITLGIDVWDGRSTQVNANFKLGTSTTYPLLLDGSLVGRQYDLGRDYYVVIDHLGIVRYRTPDGGRLGTRLDDAAVRMAIAESLDDLDLALAVEAQAAAETVAEAAAQAEAAEAAAMAAEAAQAEAEMPADMTAVLGEEAVPGTSALIGNYPNPFNAGTAIRIQLAQAGPAILDVYDIQGRLVRRLWQGRLAGGEHQLGWDGRDDAGRAVATGVYLSRLETLEQIQTRKMLLLR